MVTPIALGMPGGAEWIVIAAIGLLLFGKRLPEVGRSLGKGIVEFKKGLRGIEEELDFSSSASHVPARRGDDGPRTSPVETVETSVPKFEPPTSAPVPQD